LNVFIFLIYYYFEAPTWPYFQDEFYAIVFGIIVLNAATNKNSIIKIENKLFNYLGTISYSTYMVHLIALAFSFGILNQLDMLNNVRVYALSIAVTYLLSIIVNKYFESWFLAFKSKFNS
jgi:peptidoglycan/LPS O-acetylase OafA/YrhL